MKAFLTVIGTDKVGIIAAVSTLLADNGVNIEDISQTIMQGTFTMVMAVDLAGAKAEFGKLKAALEKCASDLGVEISLRHADIFNAMHKI